MHWVSRLKRWGKRALGRELYLRPEIGLPTERHGSAYGGWSICPEGLSAATVVYSFGLGEDVSFEESLIARYGLRIEGFDPTPRSQAWLKTRGMPQTFRAHGYGLAAKDEERTLFLPADPRHVSLSVVSSSDRTRSLRLPLKRLTTIMTELDDTRIDILKMDIEGAEYETIEDIAVGPVRPTQLLVEYHHRFETVGNEATRKSVRILRKIGYKLFWAADSGEEYGFILR